MAKVRFKSELRVGFAQVEMDSREVMAGGKTMRPKMQKQGRA
jgi:hypothetical protein